MDTRFRLTLAAAICLLPLLPLTIRLTKLQVMDHRSLEERASGEFSRSAEEIVPRADVLDRDGKVLAESLPVWAVFVDKHMVSDPWPLARRLAPILGQSPAELARRYREGKRFPWLATRLSLEQSRAVTAARLDGVGLVDRQERFYPNGDLGLGLLGQVSPDGHGQSGLELSFDSRLAGEPIKLKVTRDGAGKLIYGSEQSSPPPAPLKLTIDRNIQYLADSALDEAAQQFHMASGFIAVEDPNTGEVLAMASWPENPLSNPLVQDTYEPGSAFKVITAAGALDSGAVKPEDVFFCENGVYQIAPGVRIHDDEPEGNLTLAGILAHSSNIGASKVVEKLGPENFYRYVRAFGFDAKTGIPLPGETAGQFRPLSELSRVALAAASYGYGIGVTPLQVLAAYSAVANGGILYTPHILAGKDPEKVRRVASQTTMETLSGMLEGVVENGTGTTARIPGYRIAGKTGTSRRIDPRTGKYSESQYNASFTGFFPASRPRWAMTVVIQSPKGHVYGAEVAAPIFGKIAQRILTLNAVPPDAPLQGGVNRSLPVMARAAPPLPSVH